MPKAISGLTAAARAEGFNAGGYLPTGIIGWRVNQLHVSTTATEIAREFWHKRAAKLSRPLKRAVVRAAIRAHQQNRAVYRAVMSGRF